MGLLTRRFSGKSHLGPAVTLLPHSNMDPMPSRSHIICHHISHRCMGTKEKTMLILIRGHLIIQIEVNGGIENLIMEATVIITSHGEESVITSMINTDTKITTILTDVLTVILGGILLTTGQTLQPARGLMTSITMIETTVVTGIIMTDIIMTTRGEDQMIFVLKVTISRISEEWGLIIVPQWDFMDKDLQIITVHSIQKNLGTTKLLPSSPLPSQILVLHQLKDPLMNPNLPWTDQQNREVQTTIGTVEKHRTPDLRILTKAHNGHLLKAVLAAID